VHTGIVVVGASVVAFLLWPARPVRTRRFDGLRSMAAAGTLVEHACAQAELMLATRSRSSPAAAPVAPPRGPLAVVAVSCVLAGAVHASVGPEHFREGVRFGVFFVVLCAMQFALAVAVLRRPSRHLVTLTALLSGGVVLLWLVTRTAGLPFGLAEVEPVGFADSLASVAELVTIAACLVWLRPSTNSAARRGWPRAQRLDRVQAGRS
jgi:hypothetical protein